MRNKQKVMFVLVFKLLSVKDSSNVIIFKDAGNMMSIIKEMCDLHVRLEFWSGNLC